jgi:hypothetical protein
MLRPLIFAIFAGILVLLAFGGTPHEAQPAPSQLDRIEAPLAVASPTARESTPVLANLASPVGPTPANIRDERFTCATLQSIALNLPIDQFLVLRI